MSSEDEQAFDRARDRAFTNYVAFLHKQGYDDKEIAVDLAISPAQLKKFIISVNEKMLDNKRWAINRAKKEGHTNSEIARYMGISEASVRTFLDQNKAKKKTK